MHISLAKKNNIPHNDLAILQGRRYYTNGALNDRTDPTLMILSTNIFGACLEITNIQNKWREAKVDSYQKAENSESIGLKDFRPFMILSNNYWRL